LAGDTKLAISEKNFIYSYQQFKKMTSKEYKIKGSQYILKSPLKE
jgi:hypothetical protein